MQLESAGALKLPQWVLVEPGHQTHFCAIWLDDNSFFMVMSQQTSVFKV